MKKSLKNLSLPELKKKLSGLGLLCEEIEKEIELKQGMKELKGRLFSLRGYFDVVVLAKSKMDAVKVLEDSNALWEDETVLTNTKVVSIKQVETKDDLPEDWRGGSIPHYLGDDNPCQLTCSQILEQRQKEK